MTKPNPKEDKIADWSWKMTFTGPQLQWLTEDGIITVADLAKVPAWNPYVEGNPLTTGKGGQPIALLDLRGFGRVRLHNVRLALEEYGLDVADADEIGPAIL